MSATSTPSTEELRELDSRAQSFIPEAAESTPHTFLTLAPATSNSYPKPRPSTSASSPKAAGTPLTEGNLAKKEKSIAVAFGAEAAQQRRSSSISSDGAKRFRVLKLGPVHFGEHAGEHQEDWHEVAVE